VKAHDACGLTWAGAAAPPLPREARLSHACSVQQVPRTLRSGRHERDARRS